MQGNRNKQFELKIDFWALTLANLVLTKTHNATVVEHEKIHLICGKHISQKRALQKYAKMLVSGPLLERTGFLVKTSNLKVVTHEQIKVFSA